MFSSECTLDTNFQIFNVARLRIREIYAFCRGTMQSIEGIFIIILFFIIFFFVWGVYLIILLYTPWHFAFVVGCFFDIKKGIN